MGESGHDSWRQTVPLADEAATEALGRAIAEAIAVGDVVALSGGLGAGKTSLARAIIRKLAGAPIDVPSPTFTLVQDYPDLSVPIVHYDLYRVASERELAEIGFGEADTGAAVLIEWPEHAGRLLPAEALMIDLAVERDGRTADLSGGGRWRERLGGLGTGSWPTVPV
jgi:tRNA threonylcarbamoyl adenosine modification protein YjeE